MSRDIAEEDWKLLRDLQELSLNTACDRVLQRVAELVASRGAENHTYYQTLWTLMQDEDEQISLMFDSFKRSTAVNKVAMWRKNGLLSEEVFGKLTKETQEQLLAYESLWKQG
ncbi:hypothetical protein [Desulfoluna butyratoxydans]|uniref:Uncharacterized protein n=1 Tax=Desulfoluna butyratoxydans TaxID=231438 RepID=A0A4U8YHE5_9BACT|nr:hypothetical protein [Desulfoluna butyratoxydans]VFQ42975.1 hypothetical protein MSL71_5970 [Desulfoluna butyratoxydans]